MTGERAQANLVGFAVALLVITSVTVVGGTIANDALTDADRRPVSTHAAAQLAAHLVDADAQHTTGPNSLDRAAVANLTAADIDEAVPPVRDRPVRVLLGGDVLLERGRVGDPDEGAVVIERRVSVSRVVSQAHRMNLAETRGVSLGDHDGRVRVSIDPRPRRAVTTVAAGGRVVLHDPTGLDGRYTVTVPDRRPLRIAFSAGEAGERRATGTATVEWQTRTRQVEPLVVTVGA